MPKNKSETENLPKRVMLLCFVIVGAMETGPGPVEMIMQLFPNLESYSHPTHKSTTEDNQKWQMNFLNLKPKKQNYVEDVALFFPRERFEAELL